MENANLDTVFLTNADLSGANLRGATLTQVELTGADLSNANLKGIRYDQFTLYSLARANTDGAILSDNLKEDLKDLPE